MSFKSVFWDPRAYLGCRRLRCYQKRLDQRNSLGKEVSPIIRLAVRWAWAGDKEERRQISGHSRTAFLLLASRTKCINTYMCCICVSVHTQTNTGGRDGFCDLLFETREERVGLWGASPSLRLLVSVAVPHIRPPCRVPRR